MKWLYFPLVIMLLFLFIGGPDYESQRLYKELWDMGHIFLFSVLIYLIMQTIFFKNRPLSKTFLWVMILSLILGLSIEILQIFVGRNFALKDIFFDMLGGAIGFITAVYFDKLYLNKRRFNFVFILLLVSISFLPLLFVLIDERNMQQNFPKLSNNSSWIYLSRWDTNKTKLSLSNDFVNKGKSTLVVTFMPAKYPDLTLQHFMGNWSGYQYLGFKIFNTQLKPINIELKIYDRAHIQRQYKYNDRFNKVIQLKKGWNNIEIPISSIINSPKERKMDISRIKSVSFFLIDVMRPIKIYLSDLTLM